MTNYKEIISDAIKRAAVSSPEKLRERKIGALTEYGSAWRIMSADATQTSCSVQ